MGQKIKNMWIFKILSSVLITIVVFGCQKDLEFDNFSIIEKDLNSGVSNDLNAIFFSSPDTGFVVGEDGLVLRTFDGGISWLDTSICDKSLRDVHFCSNKIGYIVGYQSIFMTENAGDSWMSIDTDYELLSSVSCISKDTCLIPDSYGVLRTYNKGKSWEDISFNKWTTLYSVCQMPNDKVIAVGENGSFISDDYFSTWEEINHKAYSISNIKDEFLLSAYSLTICYSDDNGINWEEFSKVDNTRKNMITMIFGNSSSEIFALYRNPSTILLRTKDFGKTWEGHEIDDINDLQNINNAIYTVGNNGKISRYSF